MYLPQVEDVLEGELPLEPDEQPAETEAQGATVLRVWRRGDTTTQHAVRGLLRGSRALPALLEGRG